MGVRIRESLRKILFISLIILIEVIISALIVSAVNFGIGNIVEVYNTGTSGLVVRGPGACDGQIGGKSDGDLGLVLDGPIYCNSYYRWKIRWEDGLEGWSAEGYPGGVDYLKKKYITPSTKFNVNDKVKVNTGGSNLIIRIDIPELAYKGIVSDGTKGTIKDGPFYGVPKGSSGFYHFWKVDYGTIEGWSAENYLELEINQPPTCSLSANPKSGKAPLTVTFSMSASDPDGSITGWILDVDGDGNGDYSGTGYPPSSKTHTYTSEGSYTAMLVVSDNDDNYDSDVETINVGSPNQPPDCSLSANPKSGKAPLEVTFSMSASDPDGSITTWVLDVDDGNSYSGNGNPPSTQIHTYTSQGNYNAVLGVSDNDDATDFATETVSVSPPTQLPSVSTSEASDINLTSATLNGNLDSTGGEICQIWFEYGLTTSYGNSTSEQSKSITGSFSEFILGLSSGTTYHFKACASNSKGTVCGSDKSFTTLIPINRPPDLPTNLAQYKSDLVTEIPVGSAIDEQLAFFKANISDPDGDQVKLQIELRQVDTNFFGGERFTQQSSLVSIDRVGVAAHALANGNYHWQARNVDEHGLASEWVSFGNNSELATDFSVEVNYLPVARFTYSPEYPEIGQEITFYGSPSYDPDGGNIISYEWDFGDGNSAQGMQVAYAYSMTGYYTVNLTVTDNEGSETTYSTSLNVFSEELEKDIEHIVKLTNTWLDDILRNAEDVAEATDYLSENVEENKVEGVIDFVFSVRDIVTPSPKIKDIPLLSPEKYAEFADDYPGYAEILHELIQGKMEIVEEEVTKDIFFGILEKISKWISYELVDTDLSSNEVFIPNLERKVNNSKNNVTNLKQDVLNDLSSLSSEEIELYQEDLRSRIIGNSFISTSYGLQSQLPVTFASLKKEDEGSWTRLLGKAIWKGSITLLSLVTGGIGGIIIRGSEAVREQLVENWNDMNGDAQMLYTGTQTLVGASMQADSISRNTIQSLENIKEKTLPNTAKGKIVSIENFMAGFIRKRVHYNQHYSFFYDNIYSEIKVKNTGNTKYTYKLNTYYMVPYSTFRLIPIIAERKYEIYTVKESEEIEIEPNQTKTFTVWYKKQRKWYKKGEGIDPKGQVIRFMLFGKNDDGGTYGLDMANTKFETTKIVLNDVNITEEELENASMYSYPISSEVGEMVGSKNYTLNIYIENPFDFPIQANLTQEIPPNFDIISAGNCTLNGNISWQFEFESEERKRINITLKPKDNLWIIEIPGAVLKIYDQVNDYWINFSSNNVTIFYKINIPLNQGWNLISLPLQPVNSSIEDLIKDLSGQIIVWNYNASVDLWTVYDTNAPFPWLNTLHNMGYGKAYWLKSTINQTLTVHGTIVTDYIIALKPGWNFVGYNMSTNIMPNPISALTTPIVVWAYYTAEDEWKVYDTEAPFPWLNTLTNMTHGRGYWLKSSIEQDWKI